MIDADHTDDLVLPTNTPALIEYLLNCLEQAKRAIGLYMKTNRVHVF